MDESLSVTNLPLLRDKLRTVGDEKNYMTYEVELSRGDAVVVDNSIQQIGFILRFRIGWGEVEIASEMNEDISSPLDVDLVSIISPEGKYLFAN